MKKISLIILLFGCLDVYTQSAIEIIQKADSKMRGASSFSEMAITIVRPKWQKTMTMKSWSLGTDYSVSLVTSPAKEKGSVFLKRKNEVWNYLPALERTIKLPPSMMTQSFMGTDLTNDDLVKQSSMVVDYTHKILSEEIVEGLDCWKLELIPNEEATVVWGKLIVWIDKSDFMQLKIEFYDDDEEIVNLMNGYNFKMFGNKKLPSKIEFIPLEDQGNKTIIEYKIWEFDKDIPSNYFTTQYVSRLK
ncbi:MAG: outer membrane lipoprotein-sorting protein [Flavobacteriales bacterium]|jgi:outer membrane lipoprotein-sorting protein|tara:strand:- start:2613 stop:3353 length:741 start_codon:yes stop_codon:yes gene_type:complete